MKRIVVENLSKVYQLGAQTEKDLSFRELLFSQVTGLFKPSLPKSSFHALDNVSFEVNEGEVFGIIGKNGSGKSTLLKILSRITSPTSGRAVIKGRVASLLEVGTGFHGELSGRENIYLSGVILGMKRWEISKHFDEIVAFAGMEQFLEVPVKKYSSGMRLRLAFSVAAHLQPEILLIDEVLAVGDYEFEKKCIQSMSELGKAGRTIIFVSHHLEAVKKLCSRVMVLNKGIQQFIGSPCDAIKTYLGVHGFSRSSMIWGQDGLVLGPLSLYGIKVLNTDLQERESLQVSESVMIEISYKIFDLKKELLGILFFYDDTDTLLFSTSNLLASHQEFSKEKIDSLFCVVPAHIFQEGAVKVGLSIFNRGQEGKVMDLDDVMVFSEKELVTFFMTEERNISLADDNFWQNQKGKIKPLVKWHRDQ